MTTAEQFNADHPIGTPVIAFPGSRAGRVLFTRTRTPAWELSDTPVVSVEDYAGGIALTHIEVIPADWPTAQEPTDAEVEAVAIALSERFYLTPGSELVWDLMGDDERDAWRANTRAALAVARAVRQEER